MIEKKKRETLDIIVLMAGEGKRMRPLTENRPKALLYLKSGNTLLGHIVDAFKNLNYEINMIPVVGHGIDSVECEIKALSQKVSIDYVYNPFYKTTGPLVSLWMGLLSSRSSNVMVINGDTLINPELVYQMNTWFEKKSYNAPSLSLCVSEDPHMTNDDMKVSCDREGKFKEVGKKIDSLHSEYVSAGVFTLMGKERKKSLSLLVRDLLKNEECTKISYHWHNLANEMNKNHQVHLIKVPRSSWCEMDTIEEFEIGNLNQSVC